MRGQVTGGAGFIGSAMVRHLIGEGRHVLAFGKACPATSSRPGLAS